MEKIKLSKGKKIFIRREKARIRREVFNTKEQEERILRLYQPLMNPVRDYKDKEKGQKEQISNGIKQRTLKKQRR